MRKKHVVPQGTEEWFNLRLGKITSSHFDTIMANEGKAFGNPAHSYARKVALEIVTGKRDEESDYSDKNMERGIELEPEARELYEVETMTEVLDPGFVEYLRFGDSSDGDLDDPKDGLGCIEIKSVLPNAHWDCIKKSSYNSAYEWQIQGHIWVRGYNFCDFVSYCPQFPERKRLHVTRVYRDEDKIERLQNRLRGFVELVDSYVNLIS